MGGGKCPDAKLTYAATDYTGGRLKSTVVGPQSPRHCDYVTLHAPPFTRSRDDRYRGHGTSHGGVLCTIRRASLTCAQKLTQVTLIYRTQPTTNRLRKEKLKSKKTDVLGSIGKQSGESVESVLKKKRKATQGRNARRYKHCRQVTKYFS